MIKKKKGSKVIAYLVSFLFLFLILLIPGFVRDFEKKIHKKIAILIPHVNSAGSERKQYLQKIANKTSPTDIIILSTNHFNAGTEDITGTFESWSVDSGELSGNSDLKQFLNIESSHEIIVSDHGIRNVIPDFQEFFAHQKVAAFIIKNGAKESSINEFNQKIITYCELSGKDCLLVASVDMSHYNPSPLAELHDEFTLSALSRGDLEKIKKAETDSKEVLSLLVKWSKANTLNNFSLYSANNTGKKNGDFETETTSWIIGDYQAGEQIIKESTTLLFAGDIMMDRLVNHRYQNDFKELFSNMGERVFWGVDASIANLEGPINNGPVEDDISVNNLVFNFPLNSIDGLKYLKLDGFSLANNHTLNDGKVGLIRTRELLEKNNFFHFGDPKIISEEIKIADINSGIPVSILGANFLESRAHEMIDLIKNEKLQGRFVIVFPHWGSEYGTSHSKSQQEIAHLLIDSGADLIVGSHPHVVQDSEIYSGKLIVYSLGNFVFDQLFSKETQMGCLLGLKISTNEVVATFIPIISKNMKPQIAKGEERNFILERIIPNGYHKELKNGKIELSR